MVDKTATASQPACLLLLCNSQLQACVSGLRAARAPLLLSERKLPPPTTTESCFSALARSTIAMNGAQLSRRRLGGRPLSPVAPPPPPPLLQRKCCKQTEKELQLINLVNVACERDEWILPAKLASSSRVAPDSVRSQLLRRRFLFGVLSLPLWPRGQLRMSSCSPRASERARAIDQLMWRRRRRRT